MEAWRVADDSARALEVMMAHAYQLYESGKGPNVAVALVREARDARELATRRLDEAIQALAAAAKRR